MKQDLSNHIIQEIIATFPSTKGLIIAFPLPLTLGEEWNIESLLHIHKILIKSKNYTKAMELKSTADFINRFIAADDNKKFNIFITCYSLLNPELYTLAKLYNE